MDCNAKLVMFLFRSSYVTLMKFLFAGLFQKDNQNEGVGLGEFGITYLSVCIPKDVADTTVYRYINNFCFLVFHFRRFRLF